MAKLDELLGSTYYEVLGLKPENASKSALRIAKRKLISTYHPDLADNEEQRKEYEEITSIVNEAFDALSDMEFRKFYDESNFTLRYTANMDTSLRGKAKEHPTEEKKKGAVRRTGMNYVSSVELTPKQAKEGGAVKLSEIYNSFGRVNESKTIFFSEPDVPTSRLICIPKYGEIVNNNENSGDLFVQVNMQNEQANIFISEEAGTAEIDLTKCRESYDFSVEPQTIHIPSDIGVFTGYVIDDGEDRIEINGLMSSNMVFIIRDTDEEKKRSKKSKKHSIFLCSNVTANRNRNILISSM